MKKNYILLLILFIFGVVITILGACFKIMHWPGAKIMLLLGMLAEAIALIILIYKMLKKSN
jgi:hypothetical protein